MLQKHRTFIILFIGIISLLINGSTFIAWYLHIDRLIQWDIHYVGMLYNTSLMLSLNSLALIFALFNRKNGVFFLTLAAISISTLSFSEDLFGIKTGIDLFFMTPYASFGHTEPGHTAPNSAVGACLIAICLLLHNLSPRKSVLIFVNYLTLIITCMGALALFGYLDNIPTAYAWGHFTKMAIQTALTFVMLGTGLFLLTFEKIEANDIDINQSLPSFAAMSGITATLLLYEALLTNPNIHEHLSNTFLVCGLIFSLFLAIISHHAYKSKRSLSLTKATFESTNDAIVVTNKTNRISDFNQNFLKLWHIPVNLVTPIQTREIRQLILDQIGDSEKYLMLIKDLYQDSSLEVNDELVLKNGNIITYHSQPQKMGGKIVGRVFTFRDVTERKVMEDQLLHQATHDTLTSLPNRALLLDRLEQAIIMARRANLRIAIIFFDLDRFKVVNDSLGHEQGDILLQTIAKRLLNCVRASDTVGRLGGDEFVVIIPDFQHDENLINILKKFSQSLSEPVLIQGRHITVTVSMGISIYPTDGEDAKTLLKNADMAMYRAKESGRNNFQYYTNEMYQRSQERMDLENDLREAMLDEQLFLYYQPLISLHENRIMGVECLMRWKHPTKGFISPQVFIPLAEETGLILQLGEWCLKQACHQAKSWENQGIAPLKMCVNLSAVQFKRGNVVRTILNVLRETQLDPQHLELELTESSIMENSELFTSAMNELKKNGLHLSIDDFGTGYSSLSYLQQFPIDTLKIDQSFIKKIPSDQNSKVIVLAIIALGKSLNLKVLAEGVETLEQLNFLKEHGCDEIQGFYFSKPLDAISATEFLKTHLTHIL